MMMSVIEIAEAMSSDGKIALRLAGACGSIIPYDGDDIDDTLALYANAAALQIIRLVTVEDNPDNASGHNSRIYTLTDLGKRVVEFLEQEEIHGGCSG